MALLWYTDACINNLYLKLQVHKLIIYFLPVFDLDENFNHALAIGEFEGIGQEIHKDLQVASGISIDSLNKIQIVFTVDLGLQFDAIFIRYVNQHLEWLLDYHA